MRFIANKISRPSFRLLILGLVGFQCAYASADKPLTTKGLDKDRSMQKTRDEIPETDRWNVAALYPTPEAWKEDLLKAQGQGKVPHWPELKSYQGKLGQPDVALSFFEYYFTLDRKL